MGYRWGFANGVGPMPRSTSNVIWSVVLVILGLAAAVAERVEQD